MSEKLLYEERTRVLRRCLFEVQNEVGLGRQEEAYHRACKIWLADNGVPFVSKYPHRLLLHGQVAHTLFPDFVAWDAITMELKAVARRLTESELVQLFDYLKCRGDRLGLMANLGLDRVHVERFIYEPPSCQLREDWARWTGAIAGRDREVGGEVREALRTIFQVHGTGYGAEVIEKLIHFELHFRGLSLDAAPVAKAFYKHHQVDLSPLDCILIEDRILLTFTALFDSNSFNFNRGRSFLKALGRMWGVAANFGKKTAELTAFRKPK